MEREEEEAQQDIRQDLLVILQETIAALKRGDYAQLKDISNHTIHNASIFQDQDSLSVAVLVYAIHKIMVHEYKAKEIEKRFIAVLEEARRSLEQQKVMQYRETIRTLFKIVAQADDNIHMYIRLVIDQAQIKKGSKLFEHGISLARAGELLGISRWELMQYVGKTRLPEQILGKVDVRERVKYTRTLFGT